MEETPIYLLSISQGGYHPKLICLVVEGRGEMIRTVRAMERIQRANRERRFDFRATDGRWVGNINSTSSIRRGEVPATLEETQEWLAGMLELHAGIN